MPVGLCLACIAERKGGAAGCPRFTAGLASCKADVSLEDAEFDFDEGSGTITAGLSEPYIISSTHDMDESGVLAVVFIVVNITVLSWE